MANKELNVKIRQRKDTEANWILYDPILLDGEMAISSDKDNRYKIGNGTSNWSELPYNLESKTASSGGTALSLVTTGEKYTWNNKTSNTGTVTSVATGVGLTTASGSAVTTSGTIKAKLKSESNATYDSNTASNTSGKQYPVVPDKSGYLSVNVPWTDNNTRYDADAVCATAGATKTASATGYTLTTGNRFTLRVTTANTATSACTLNVASTGAKPLYLNGAAISSTNNSIPTGDYQVYYNGTNYYIRNDGGIPYNDTFHVSDIEDASPYTYSSLPLLFGDNVANNKDSKMYSYINGPSYNYWSDLLKCNNLAVFDHIEDDNDHTMYFPGHPGYFVVEESGTWTPTFNSITGLSVDSANYRRMNDLVEIVIVFITTSASTQRFYINSNSLPFAVASLGSGIRLCHISGLDSMGVPSTTVMNTYQDARYIPYGSTTVSLGYNQNNQPIQVTYLYRTSSI